MKLDDLKNKWKTLDKQLPEGKIVNRQALRDLIRKTADEDADCQSLPEPGVEEHTGDRKLLGDGG